MADANCVDRRWRQREPYLLAAEGNLQSRRAERKEQRLGNYSRQRGAGSVMHPELTRGHLCTQQILEQTK